MKHDKIQDVVKSGNIVIPLYIYKDFSKLNIDYESFIFLMYLYNKGNKIPFDINTFGEELFCSTKDIMNYVSVLQKNKLIDIKATKNEKNIMEEYIYLDFFYEKITLNLINDNKVVEDNTEKDEIFKMLEEDVGLQLSFVEIEIVKAWNYDKEVIKEAIKEAINNKVASIRYIDKILYTWAKKGIKTKEDLENNRKSYKSKDEKVDVFEYNWLDDDDK